MASIRKKILLIDDEAVFMVSAIQALTPCGYYCIAEENPANGIMRLKKESVDMVLLDIMMEPIDGWDTLQHIRNNANGTDVPVMMSSAKKLFPDEVIRYGSLVDGFIVKPFVDAELCETIADFFSWYESLNKNAKAARMQGISEEVYKKWIQMNRQVRGLSILAEILTPQCIPNGFETEEECLESRKKIINRLISDKRKECVQLQIQYPVFSF